MRLLKLKYIFPILGLILGLMAGTVRAQSTLSISPADFQVTEEETFSIDIVSSTNIATQSLSGATVVLNFNPNLLQVEQVTNGNILDVPIIPTSIDNNLGRVEYNYGTFGNTTFGNSVVLFSVSFKALTEAPSTTISFITGGLGTDLAFNGQSVLDGVEPASLTILPQVVDSDGDGFGDDVDNCPAIANANQSDYDNDGIGDVCDDDADGDGLLKGEDCNDLNPNVGLGPIWYADTDQDGYGDPNVTQQACTQPAGYVSNNQDCDDQDGGINPNTDEIPNDGIDQDCDGSDLITDTDGDGIDDVDDNCPNTPNPLQRDFDNDGIGDVCDDDDDGDGDGVLDTIDNCLLLSNPDQSDIDNDGLGDACDDDADGDGIVKDEDCDDLDAGIGLKPTWFADFDGDGFGDPENTTLACTQPGNYVADNTDNCPQTFNPVQADLDADGIGNICDHDKDGDGVLAENDCDDLDASIGQIPTWYVDSDQDGFGNPAISVTMCTQPAGYVANDDDCNDADAGINPATDEIPNDGIDQNCDGIDLEVDSDDDGILDNVDNCPGIANPDQSDMDNDGLGDVCDDDADGDGILAADDCNDLDASIGEPTIWYADFDADGFGDPNMTQEACDQPANYVANDTDNCPSTANADQADLDQDGIGDVCDEDADGDGILASDDCNDLDASIGEPTIWYADFDADGFGDPNMTQEACDQPANYVANDTDNCPSTANADQADLDNDGIGDVCDDDADGDGILAADDCNDLDAAIGEPTIWHADLDGDGFGDPNMTQEACEQPANYVANFGDCDDSNSTINPGATEIPNDGIDQNCDGQDLVVDSDGDGIADNVDNCPQTANADQADLDNDGIGDVCDDDADGDGILAADDCNDLDASIGEPTTWYADLDGDGFGDPNITQEACEQPANYVANSGDCDDSNSAINPGATEIPNDGIDQNCDGQDLEVDSDGDGIADNVDNCPSTANADQSDLDNDGIGDVCDDDVDGDGILAADDCNDLDAAIGEPTTWYADLDGDGFGDPNMTQEACNQPANYVANNTDNCPSTANTDQADQDNDGIGDVCDDDADGDGILAADDCNDLDAAIGEPTIWYADLDEDGFGDPNMPQQACDQPVNYVANNTDNCPEAANADQADLDNDGVGDVCDDDADGDGILAADDCNDLDASIGEPTNWYADLDEDGFGDPSMMMEACDQPTNYVANSGDCDDRNSAINPGATEIPNDGIDQNCDGQDLEVDSDGDGIADNVDNCPQTANSDQADLDQDGNGDVCDDDADGDGILAADDCNDLDAAIGEPTTWYADLDGDGFGDPNMTQEACEQPVNFVAVPGDCDDSNELVNPNAEEILDGLDNDCDGLIDEDLQACTATGQILREVWTNISGNKVSTIPLQSAPSFAQYLNAFEAPVNVGNNYGSRIRGYICPPQNGEYIFWISGDDQSVLYLSNDDAPENKQIIAEIPGWTTSRQWDKYPRQKSISIYLEENKRYYIEALHKEAGGGDNLAVGWQLPDGSLNRPISGQYLSPYTADLRIADNPTNVNPGVETYYYEGSWRALPDFDNLEPLFGLVTDNIDLNSRLRNDEFAMQYKAYIKVPADAHYTFTVGSDDGSKLYIGDQLVVYNDGLHAYRERSGSIGLQKGLHEITIQFFEFRGGEQLEVYWQGNSFDKEIIPASVLYQDGIDLILRPADNPQVIAPGVEYYYYEGSWNSIPEFDNLQLLNAGIIDNFSLAPRWRNDEFGMVFKAYIDVPVDNYYQFSLISDDGSKLLIGDQVVVDNDGLHASQERTGIIGLEAGKHQLTIQFFEKRGQEELEVFWNTLGMPKAMISSSLLYQDGLDLDLNPAVNVDDLLTGLNYNYYHGNWSFIPDFDQLSPVSSGYVDEIQIDNRIRNKNFGFEFFGYIEVPKDDMYTFILGSDDGSQLWIEDELVVDNNGLHAYKEDLGSIALAAGLHSIKIKYFERSGSEILEVFWQSSDISRQKIAASNLFRTPMDDIPFATNNLLGPPILKMEAFPNPFQQSFILEFSNQEIQLDDLIITISNMDGTFNRLAMNKHWVKLENKLQIDLSEFNLPEGYYLLKLEFADGMSQYARILKQN